MTVDSFFIGGRHRRRRRRRCRLGSLPHSKGLLPTSKQYICSPLIRVILIPREMREREREREGERERERGNVSIQRDDVISV